MQEQAGINKGKWKTMGRVVEVSGHESYLIRMDGSGITSKKRRSFLKLMKPSLMKILETLGRASTPLTPNKLLETMRHAPPIPTSSNTTGMLKKVPESSTRVL